MDFANAATYRPTLLGRHHMVVAGHPLATMAGMKVLEAGGNAIDAGVAAGFALNVVLPDMANLGGVAPIVLALADAGRVTTINGVGRWPRAATRERVAAAGNGRIPASPARWVVPAAVDAWLTALARYGTISAADALRSAIELADHGFPATYFTCHNLRQAQAAFASWAHNWEVFFPQDRAPEIGEPIRQRALADSLHRLADAERTHGGSRVDGIHAARNAFYKGEIAERIGAFAREVGSFLTADDLAEFSVAETPAATVTYRGHTVHGCGPWSQGPALLQMLALLDGVDLAGRDAAEAQHLMIESAKLALTDRNRFYGDPDFVDVPLDRLLSPAYTAERRAELDPDRIARRPLLAPAGAPSPDTTYVCVVDRWGNAFSAAPSDSTILVTPMVPGLGFGISDRGLQASLDPADPNVVQPRKRPRLTPCPAILSSADALMPFGTPGGEVQTQAMLQVLVNHLDLGMDLQAAVEAPRWVSYAVPSTEDPHPMQPDNVCLEDGAPADLRDGLARRGHDVQSWPRLSALAGSVCAIRRDQRTGVLAGAADPRRMAYGIGW